MQKNYKINIPLEEINKYPNLKKSLENWAKKYHQTILSTSKKIIIVGASSILLNASTVKASELEVTPENSIETTSETITDRMEFDFQTEETLTEESLQELESILEEYNLEINEILQERTYYDIPIETNLQDLIYDLCETYNVPAKIPFTIIEVVSNGNWDSSNTKGLYGLSRISEQNLNFIENNYGYNEEEIINNTEVNIECTIRLLHDVYLPAANFDENKNNYEDIFGIFSGWTNWQNDERSRNFVTLAMNTLNTKFNDTPIKNEENTNQTEYQYYNIPEFDTDFQEYIYNKCVEWDVPYKPVFTFLDIESGGTWTTNGVISKTNDYGLSQINKCNLSYIKKNYGYTKEEVLNDPYINVECCIRLLHDVFLPCVHFDPNNPDYEALFAAYNGGPKWRSKKNSLTYAKKALNVLNTKYANDFVSENPNTSTSVPNTQEETFEITETNAIENQNENEWEKYYIRLYTDIYGLDYETVYQIISNLTNNFQNENYQTNFIIENQTIPCTSKEMALLYTIHNIYTSPSTYHYNYTGEIPTPMYMETKPIEEQMAYVSNVLGVDETLTYTICQVTFGFDNPMYLINNNPGGIKMNNEYASFPTKTAGFAEVALKILEAKNHNSTDIMGLSTYFEQNTNPDWTYLVEYFYTFYKENPSECYSLIRKLD